jgi:hypothetical protein
LDANVGKRPSLAWRSIISAKGLIKQETIWRVGNGEDIRVWGDCWLPKPSTFSVQSPRTRLEHDAKVCDLMDEAMGGWKKVMISEIFSVEEAAVIQAIPLSPLRPKDKLIWRCTANGEFSVRNAYHLAVERQSEGHGEASVQG